MLNRFSLFMLFALSAAAFALLLFIVSLPLPYQPDAYWVYLLNHFCTLTPNGATYVSVGKVSIFVFVYLFIFLSAAVWMGCWGWKKRKTISPKPLPDISRILIAFSLLALGIVTFFQTRSLVEQFAFEFANFQGKTTAEKERLLFPHTYAFSTRCRDVLKGKHFARVATDLNLKQGLGQDRLLELAYLLYPIDIKVHQEKNPEVLLVYEKHRARAAVPEGFKIISVIDPHNLIAIKETAP